MPQFDYNSVMTRELTPEERRIIVDRGTEPPFSGKYYNFFEKGLYTCKRCGAPLYRSESKFDAGCGWPAFDEEIEGAVKRTPDPDGIRTEISCAKCGAHLGHVFVGEGFTPKNTRHCVNSLSLEFIPAGETIKESQAYFAGGCFWGVEHLLKDWPGVLTTRVGYMGGHKPNPSYEEVCSGETGHLETVEVTFDEEKTDFETLARFFFEIHDPTQINRQGPDVGEQYSSAIFYVDDTQKRIAEHLITKLREKGYPVVTKLKKAEVFWPAEEYHQRYYQKTGKLPYCHFYTKRF